MAIYIKGEMPKTIKELLTRLFSCNASAGRVYPYNEYLTNIETYSDSNCTEIQCVENKYRSFDDIIELINTYFPNTDNLTILHELLTLEVSNSAGELLLPRQLMCNAIEKPTIYYSNRFEKEYNGGTFTNSKGNQSNYTWKDLLGELGITNFEELQAYIDKHRVKKEELILT